MFGFGLCPSFDPFYSINPRRHDYPPISAQEGGGCETCRLYRSYTMSVGKVNNFIIC